jgi:hypothetical protein
LYLLRTYGYAILRARPCGINKIWNGAKANQFGRQFRQAIELTLGETGSVAVL